MPNSLNLIKVRFILINKFDKYRIANLILKLIKN